MKTMIKVVSSGLTAFALGCSAFSYNSYAACPEICDNSNTGLGVDALINNTGADNTAVGYEALGFASMAYAGSGNTAVGAFALQNNTGAAGGNTAVGYNALNSNHIGFGNTAVGNSALSNSTVDGNTAIGAAALKFSASALRNCALGSAALYKSEGNDNTAAGYEALLNNTSGFGNTAIGTDTLRSNSTAANNTATGYQALYSNKTDTTIGAQGEENTADGAQALYSNSIGYFNVASGFQAAYKNTTGSQNTATGVYALSNNTTGWANIAIGTNAGINLTTGSNNIDIGNKGVAGESGKIRIGTKGTHKGTFVAGIYNVTEAAASGIKPVYINSNGQLGTAAPGSSARFKENIKRMDKSSEAILGLKPVIFKYKNDSEGTPQFGLIAEEVAKVNPDLVIRDENGQIYTVRYEAVNAMLLNEFLKEHARVQELNGIVTKQDATNAQQQKELAALRAELQEQKTLVQKVNEKIELAEASPRVASNSGE
jgi:trimeric autotransporter adhesin